MLDQAQPKITELELKLIASQVKSKPSTAPLFIGLGIVVAAIVGFKILKKRQ